MAKGIPRWIKKHTIFYALYYYIDLKDENVTFEMNIFGKPTIVVPPKNWIRNTRRNCEFYRLVLYFHSRRRLFADWKSFFVVKYIQKQRSFFGWYFSANQPIIWYQIIKLVSNWYQTHFWQLENCRKTAKIKDSLRR